MNNIASMTGKTVLITGATDGIGKETALGLAKTGARIVIVGRNQAKALAVCQSLKSTTGNQQIEFLIGDLSLMADIRRVAAEFQARFESLHVLLNNVGAMNLSRQVTAEGFELTFAMNHLGPSLLTRLLLPPLERSAPSRIINVSSDAHRRASIDFEDLQSEKAYGAFRTYARSKLMNILFTRELARQVGNRNITANALHPGLVASNFMKKPGVLGAVGNLFFATAGISTEKGARTSIHLATAPEVDAVTGKYFVKSREVPPSRAAQDDSAARRLWEVSEGLVR